jgi:hypothetical protein
MDVFTCEATIEVADSTSNNGLRLYYDATASEKDVGILVF